MTARVLHSSLPPLSRKATLCWEKVLRSYCEFGIGQEYQELDDEGKRAMLLALASSVLSLFGHAAAMQEGQKNKKRSKNAPKEFWEDPLIEAVLAMSSGDKAVVNTDASFLDQIRFDFLGSWGVAMSSDSLLREHLQHGMLRNLEEKAPKKKSEVQIATTNESVRKSSENSSWNALRPMSISELKLFKTMKGRRLECEVVGEPHHRVGVTTILQDLHGSTVQCGIYNLPGVVDTPSAERALPTASTVIIAEPFLKVMMDGKRGIRVDNPAEIHIFPPGCRPLTPSGSIAAGKYQSEKVEEQAESQDNPAGCILEDYKVGQRVKLTGLTSKKGLSLNGRLGVICGQDREDLERVTVEIDSDTGKPEVLKIKPDNLEIIADSSFDDILKEKTEANEAFSKGEIDKAVDRYNILVSRLSSHKSSKAVSELTKCLCNRALCLLKQKKWGLAKSDAKLALEHEPANAKAHFRVACAIFQDGDVASQEEISEAAFHASVALALLPRAETSMTDLLQAISDKSAKVVAKPDEIRAVSTCAELRSALALQHIKLIVLRPGDYHFSDLQQQKVVYDSTLVGLGQVNFFKYLPHVLMVCGARLHLSHVRVLDGCKYEPRFAAFGVEGSAGRLTLSHCVVEDSCEVGIIVADEGCCKIEDCQFRRLGKQAVEVREMGQVEVRRSHFSQVWQGVCAYAGARSVVMEKVVIENCVNEGVMASGDFQTPETQKLELEYSDSRDGPGMPGWHRQRNTSGKLATMMAKSRAEDLDWIGRLVVDMSDCTIKHARGLACSIDEGCAAALTRCTFEATLEGIKNPWPGFGVFVKGGSDARITNCRFLENKVAVEVGFNYSGTVLVEGSIFAQNFFDVVDETQRSDIDKKLTPEMRSTLPKWLLEKEAAERLRHEKAGAWSGQKAVQQSGNRFLSKSERVPEIHELQPVATQQKRPLPQKLAWEAAARGKYDLVTPCLCGFSCTELGNSTECNQLGLGNHIDFPPFMCLPCSERLNAKQDDPNAQFYFRTDDRAPVRHWCFLGQVISVDLPRTADAHSFMASSGVDAAKSIKLQTKFADQSVINEDVEVLLLSDEPLVNGSCKVEPGSTLAALYAEANEIDITRGTGQILVARNSLIYTFHASLDEVIAQASHCFSVADAGICGGCGKETSAESKRSCSGCQILEYCSEKCLKGDKGHQRLCPQMGMLRKLATADFRSFESQVSFAKWADELQEEMPSKEIIEKPLPSETGTEKVPLAEDLCNLLDAELDVDLAEAIGKAEEALQEKDSDGCFVITKSTGRNKLQNKLKRARGRLAKVEQRDEPAPAAAVEPVEEAAPDYAEHPALEEKHSTGLGSIDSDGYHGVPWQWLPPWADISYSGWRLCRKASHLFLSYPKHSRSPSEDWCTNINPRAFCCDFAEVVSQARKPRVMSCWGHGARPGNPIPSMASGTRLWKLRPSEIAFSQDSISKKFKDGHSLDGTLEQLLSGNCKVEDIEKIQITWHSDPQKSPGQARWWTYTGNRRLSLFQTLEEKGKLQYIVAEWVNVPVPDWRMTTKNSGQRPFVRYR